MYQKIHTEIVDASVGVITLSDPESLNALSQALVTELNEALDAFEEDDKVKAIIITGTGKAFCAGAYIPELQELTPQQALKSNFVAQWEALLSCQKPIIAAVNGYALGGGFELALMCDMILASDIAQFGQPEVKLGTLPGAGGTQRLTHLIGKARTMELCLTGRMISAEEAYAIGLLTRVVPEKSLLEESKALAKSIAEQSQDAARRIKKAIQFAEEGVLGRGIAFERALFYDSFSSKAFKQGIDAFVKKQKG